MNRTVRNGLAVATMAGGIWLLGQAVASADTGATADAVNGPASSTSTTEAVGGDADAIGHDVYVEPTQSAESGGNAGVANSGNTVSVDSTTAHGSGNGNPTTSSGDASVTNTGGNASNTVGDTTVSGDTTATAGSASSGDASGTSDSVSVGGSGSSSSGGTASAGSSASSSSSGSSGGSSGGSSTTVGSGAAGGSATAGGHLVVVAPEQEAQAAGNVGAANSGNTVTIYCVNFKNVTTCGNAITTSGDASVTNTGGNASNTVGDTTVSGNTSATGGDASTGDASGSADSLDLGEFYELLEAWLAGGGSSTDVFTSAVGGSATAYGHGVLVAPYQGAYAGGNEGYANTGNTVTIYCINFKSDNNCNPVTTSGDATVTNTGGNASNTVGGTTVSGSTTATGGGATSGSATGSADSASLGYGGGSTTTVGNSATGGSADAEGHLVVVAPGQYAWAGGNKGWANSGNTVVVHCFNYKSNNNCNPVTTSGDATVTNTGGNASNTVGGTTVGGTTSATGGDATTGSATGSADSLTVGSGYGYGYGSTTTVDNSATGGSASAAGHWVLVAPGQYAWAGGNKGWANSGNTVVVHCFNYKSDDNCNPITTSGDATVVNEGGNASNHVGDTTVDGCTSAVGGSVNGATSGSGCSAEEPTEPTEPTTPTEPTHPAQPETPAQSAPAAAVQHVAPVVAGYAHTTAVTASYSAPASLAYTGADVSDALGLGLLALAGGLGLALAGRRRTTV